MHASADSLLRVLQLALAGGNLSLAAYGTYNFQMQYTRNGY